MDAPAVKASIRVKEEEKVGLRSRILTRILPVRVKRAWFLASIISLVEGIDDTDVATVEKINKLLQLAYDRRVLTLPMHVKEMLWEDRVTTQNIQLKDKQVSVFDLRNVKLDSADLVLVAKFFSALAPRCLIYGSDDRIAQDLGKIFGEESKFSSLRAA